MSAVTWGMLEKNQEDPEKIEEAIERIVKEHNEDETAHLGAGQSLSKHKLEPIIDHLVASIIADKIKDAEIGPIKLISMITDPVDLGVVEDFTSFTQYVTNSGVTYRAIRRSQVRTGATINSIASNYNTIGFYPGYSNNFKFDLRVYLEEGFSPDAEAYIKIGGDNYLPDTGNTDSACFGFKLTYNEANDYMIITGFVRRYTTLQTKVLIDDGKQTMTYILSIERVGDDFKFYVDGVLKATIRQINIPPLRVSEMLVHAIKNTAAYNSESLVTNISYKLWYP